MYLDHKNPESRAVTVQKVRAALHEQRMYAKRWGLDIELRLVANDDGECWIATGDVSYDTEHGAACAAIEVTASDTDEDLDIAANHLVGDLVDELLDGEES